MHVRRINIRAYRRTEMSTDYKNYIAGFKTRHATYEQWLISRPELSIQAVIAMSDNVFYLKRFLDRNIKT
jgi:hypothetical protein